MTNKKRGFTLVETLVAVVILVTAITGPLTIASKGLSSALIAKDQITAFYLAQDAVEYVRFIRDSNRLQGLSWLVALNGTSNSFITANGGGGCLNVSGFGCYFDSTGNPTISGAYNLAACPDAVCAAATLYYNSTGQQYTYDSTSPNVKTIFKRVITLTQPATDEAVVTVVVSWSDTANVTRNVTVHENIFNWQP